MHEPPNPPDNKIPENGALIPVPMPVFPARTFGLEMLTDLDSEGLIIGDVVLVDPDAPFVDSALYIVQVLDRKMMGRVHKNGSWYKLVCDGWVEQVDCAKVKFLGRVIGCMREH